MPVSEEMELDIKNLWRGSLLPLGREAASKKEGLLRSPTGASSYQTKNNSLFLLLKNQAALTNCIPNLRAFRSKARN